MGLKFIVAMVILSAPEASDSFDEFAAHLTLDLPFVLLPRENSFVALLYSTLVLYNTFYCAGGGWAWNNIF